MLEAVLEISSPIRVMTEWKKRKEIVLEIFQGIFWNEVQREIS